MRIAGIDIGTNTLLLLIADVDDGGSIHPVLHEQRLPRLGKNVDGTGMIHVSSFDRIAWIVNEYKNLAIQHRAEGIVAFATSVVRDAENREEFVSYLEKTTGLFIETLSGEDEALWTYRGAVSGISETEPLVAVVDIGGGSTEISYPNPEAHNGNLHLNRYSLQAGCVRLSERFFKHEPPLAGEMQSAQQYLLE